MVREHRVPGVAMLAMALVAAMLALASVGRLDGSGLLYIVNRPPPQRPPRVLSRPGGYPLQDIIVEEEVGVVAPDPKFIPTMSTTIQCLNGQNFDNARLVVTDTCMFNTGDLNVTNSTIIFTNLVQFFSTKQTIILSSDSKWTFTNTTTVMVVTTWSGTGTFEFSESSNLTIATSNTLTIECQSVFKGSITIGNTRTKLLLNGPSINTGTIYLVDRTSEYVCATTPSLGRCVLDSVNVVSQATDLTGWRIAQQLECRGGTMVVNNCTIGSQTTLPFELILLSTPRWSVLNLNNITRASLFCGTKFGSTAFSDTTAFLVDTTCTYWGNTSWSNVADPFQPSDGFVIDYGTLVFANVTQTSKGLYITNGNFHIDGTSFYVDVKATDRGSWSLPLLEYNMTQCKTDWDDFITIQNCPTYSDCRWSAATLPNGRCVVYFHYNDWFESNDSLWWLLFLALVPCLCLCWVCCCWGRKYKRKQETKLREEPAPAAELAYGREALDGRAVTDQPALHQINDSRRPSDVLRHTTSIGPFPGFPATPTSRAVEMDNFEAQRDQQADSVFMPRQQQAQQKGGNVKV